MDESKKPYHALHRGAHWRQVANMIDQYVRRQQRDLLQSNMLKWTALGPDYELPLKQCIHWLAAWRSG